MDHVCRRDIQGFQRYPHAFSERVILHRLAGGRRQKEPFALTRQLRSCVVVLPQDVERERFEGNSASDPRTALLHQHVGPDTMDIKIGRAEVTAFGGGDAGAQKVATMAVLRSDLKSASGRDTQADCKRQSSTSER